MERDAAGDIDLTAEVLKVPHHGSADFSQVPRSSGTRHLRCFLGYESALKEYIHPRAAADWSAGPLFPKGSK